MQNLIQNVYSFNETRGLLDTYDVKKEAALLLEEVLELFENENPRELARQLVEQSAMTQTPISSDSNQIDSYIDIIYIAIGSLIKKYNTLLPAHLQNRRQYIKAFICKAIDNVCIANSYKKGKLDEKGKYVKTDDFEEPFIPTTLEDLYKTAKEIKNGKE